MLHHFSFALAHCMHVMHSVPTWGYHDNVKHWLPTLMLLSLTHVYCAAWQTQLLAAHSKTRACQAASTGAMPDTFKHCCPKYVLPAVKEIGTCNVTK